MIQWRQLLDAIGVGWTDRGKNTARGHVNIACPWCGNADPSFHLGIEEATGAYYCLRSHPPHAGRSTPYLLLHLGVESYQIDGLIREFSDNSTIHRTAPRQEPSDWSRFSSAADHPAAVAYLRDERGLDPAAVIARKYDMRFTTVGRHSWRILLPLRLNRELNGWTGRAISDRTEPRYLTNDPSDGSALCIPVYPVAATHTVHIVEGPFDAIAICDAYPQHEVVAIAVLGLNANPFKREHLADTVPENKRVLITLDADQNRRTVQNFKNMLAKGTGLPYPQNFPLPAGIKDAGEMSRRQIRAWHDAD